MLFNKNAKKKDIKISNKVKNQLIKKERDSKKGVQIGSQHYIDMLNRKRKHGIRVRKLGNISRKINYRQKKGKATNKNLYKKVA